MKILVPITSPKDVEILDPLQYNTEFFCGYLPQWWISKYNNIKGDTERLSTPINNRNLQGANVTSLDDLKKIVEIVQECETTLFLVLNAKYYPEYMYGSIATYLDEVISVGITRMIVADLGMINYLSKNYPQVKVSVSCLNQITNAKSVEFYKKFSNVNRIVFPRHMSTKEIKNIATANSELEFEYFIFSNKCLYDDGYCRGIHEFTPICKDLFYSDFYLRDGKIIDSKMHERLRRAEYEYSNWTRSELSYAGVDFCTPNFACTACSLVKLKKVSNISSVKMSIRGHDISERLRQVQMANEVITRVRNGASLEEVKKTISKLYGKESLCDDGMSCMMI